jgi:hypothetical protein
VSNETKEEARRYQPKPNTCGLFDNTRNDRSDLTGQIQIECPRCHATSGWWANAWRKTSQNGLAYISLVIKPKGDTPSPRSEEW